MKKYVKPTFEIARFELCDSILTLSMAGSGTGTDLGKGEVVFPEPVTAASLLGNTEE